MAHDHESIEYGLGEVKELYDASVHIGVIQDVDNYHDTADVDIVGIGIINDVPIFYHCGGESTVEGGSAAFNEGDSVYVLNKRGNPTPNIFDLKIVGFVDGLKQCNFQFKITRDDGEIIDESYSPTFQILNSNMDEVTGDATYNSDTKYWMITLDQSYGPDTEGYWVSFLDIEDSIDLQYPFKYKYDDQEQTEDLIKVGKYEAAVPYWNVEDYENPEIIEKAYQCASSIDLGNGVIKTPEPQSKLWFAPGGSGQLGITVKASIPYKLIYSVDGAYPSGHYYGTHGRAVAHPAGYFTVEPGAESLYYGGYMCGYVANGRYEGRVLVNYPTGFSCYIPDYDQPQPEDQEEISEGSIEGKNHCLDVEDASVSSGWFPSYGPPPPDNSLAPELLHLATILERGSLGVSAQYDY